MMTKKDFIALADAIIAHNAACSGELPFNFNHVGTLAAFCRSCNPRFNRERWLGYITGECGPNGGAIRKPKDGAS
jgi:hypothetical protein